MEIDGAIVKEQGITFAIVIVKSHVIQEPNTSSEMLESLSTIVGFRGLPIVLAAQNSKGVFTYQGRDDIVSFLASIDSSRIPWKRYSVS